MHTITCNRLFGLLYSWPVFWSASIKDQSTRSLQKEAVIVKMQRGSNPEHRASEDEDQSTAPDLSAKELQNFL